MNNIKIEGLPGTGKTTKLMSLIDSNNELNQTVLCTFRREMAQELKDRLLLKGHDRHELHNVGTIHAICMDLAGISREQVIKEKEQKQFCESFGVDYKINGKFIDPTDSSAKAPGNVMFDLYGWINNNMATINDIADYPNRWRLPKSIDVSAFLEGYEQYKEENNKKDYSDMLNDVLKDKVTPDCSVLMVDEFQDLTPAQYEIFKLWSENADNVYIAGDPYQCIYPFFGGSPEFFKNWDGELEILPESRRFGTNTWKFAKGILEGAGYEDIPEIKVSGNSADVRILDAWEYLDTALPNFTSNTYHLVRCKYMAYKIANRLASAGIPFYGEYGWKETEMSVYNGLYALRTDERISKLSLQTLINVYPDSYFSTKKEKLLEDINKTKKSTFDLNDIKRFIPQQNNLMGTNFIKAITDKIPLTDAEISSYEKMKIINALDKYNKPITFINVYLGTIHSVKGREADNVFIWNELSPIAHKNIRTTEGLQAESRVWFVAATRARNNLYWVNSNTHLKYEV